MDSLTILRAKGTRQVKGWMGPEYTPLQPHRRRYFDQEVVEVNDIYDLAAKLRILEKCQDCFVIRGELKPCQGEMVRRKSVYATDNSHHWVCLDFDLEKEYKDWKTDPEFVCHSIIVEYLPKEFGGCSFFWQWSASQGIKKGTRLHLWFWLAQKANSQQLKWLFEGNGNVDHALFNLVQVHITGKPPFLNGAVDPCPVRSGFFQGPMDAVDIKIPTGPKKPELGCGEWVSVKKTEYHGSNVIQEFNRRVPVPRALEKVGYKRIGDRWLHPASQSGVPSVMLTDSGKAWSHSPNDPIHGEKACDAFDIFRIYEADGSYRVAVYLAAEMLKGA